MIGQNSCHSRIPPSADTPPTPTGRAQFASVDWLQKVPFTVTAVRARGGRGFLCVCAEGGGAEIGRQGLSRRVWVFVADKARWPTREGPTGRAQSPSCVGQRPHIKIAAISQSGQIRQSWALICNKVVPLRVSRWTVSVRGDVNEPRGR